MNPNQPQVQKSPVKSKFTGESFYDDELVSAWPIAENESVYPFYSGAEVTKTKPYLAQYTLGGKNPLEMPGIIKDVHFSIVGPDGAPINVNDPDVMTELNKLIKQTSVSIEVGSRTARKMRVEEYCHALPLIGTNSSTINPYRKSCQLDLIIPTTDTLLKATCRLMDGAGAFRPTAKIANYLLRMHMSVRLFTANKKK